MMIDKDRPRPDKPKPAPKPAPPATPKKTGGAPLWKQ